MLPLLMIIACTSVDGQIEVNSTMSSAPAVKLQATKEYAGPITTNKAVQIPGSTHTVTLISIQGSVVNDASGQVVHAPGGHANLLIQRGDDTQHLVVDIGKQYRSLGLNLRVHGTSDVVLIAGLGELSGKFPKVP
jgi:nitrous oxidase accessory protein NosD